MAILETKMSEELRLSVVSSHISIGSYICRGFNNSFKKDYIATLLYGCGIFCLQEHWLCNKQLSELSYTYDGFVSAAVSGLMIARYLVVDLTVAVLFCGGLMSICIWLWLMHIAPVYVLHVLSLLCGNCYLCLFAL